MPPNEVPPAQQPVRSPRRRIAAIAGAAIVLVIAAVAAYFFYFSTQHRVTIRSNGPFQGSLVVFLPTVWEVSDVKYSGLISVTPATKEVSTVISPTSGTVISAGQGTFNSDGVHMLATQQATTTQLVSFNRSTQKVDEVIQTLPDGGKFLSYVWSPDGSRVAYVALDPSKGAYLGVTGKEVPDDLGIATPIAFSPDATQLLVNGRSGLEMIDLTTGAHVMVTSMLFQKDMIFKPSLSGNYLLAVPPGDAEVATLFRLDWKGRALARAGYLGLDKGSVIFTSNDELLQVKENNVAYDYQVTDAGLELHEVYKFDLPADAHILYWNKP